MATEEFMLLMAIMLSNSSQKFEKKNILINAVYIVYILYNILANAQTILSGQSVTEKKRFLLLELCKKSTIHNVPHSHNRNINSN